MDKTEPAKSPYILTENDVRAIEKARSEGGDPWKSAHVADLRKRTRTHNLVLQAEQCCYCRRSLAAEHLLAIDPEHVLPKRKFPDLMFEPINLSIACKRCNMTIKRDRIDFVTDQAAARTRYAESTLYSFLHPNLDEYYKHLTRCEIALDQHRLLKYFVLNGSLKGRYTYDYFRLSELEIDSFDRAQGRALGLPNESRADIIDELLRVAEAAERQEPPRVNSGAASQSSAPPTSDGTSDAPKSAG